MAATIASRRKVTVQKGDHQRGDIGSGRAMRHRTERIAAHTIQYSVFNPS
jgi:hypothetical protein